MVMPDGLRVPRSLAAAAIALFAVGPMAAFARQGLVPLMVLAALALLYAAGRPRLRWDGPTAFWCLALPAWAAVTTLKTGAEHLVTLVRVLLVVLAIGLAIDAIGRIEQRCLRPLAAWAAIGSWLLVAVLIAGLFSGGALLELLKPDLIGKVGAGNVPEALIVISRGTGMAAVALPAWAFFTAKLTGSRAVSIMFVALSAIAAVQLPMMASAVATAAAVAAWLVTRARPRLGLTLVALGYAALLTIFPLIVPSAPARDGRAVPTHHLALSIEPRIGVWRHVGTLIREAPLVGHGFNASRVLSRDEVRIPGTDWFALPIHPHNFALQIWLELGAIGAALALALIWRVWRWSLSWADRPEAAALIAATAAPIAVIGGLSYSLWGYAWIATAGFALLFTALALRLVDVRARSPQG